MKINLSDRLIAWLTLLSGLTISAVAVWYSVAGLVSIFAAAVIPIIVMGVALEVSKLIATVWLKLNWQRAPTFIRAYLLAAIAILMVITSMGIFGFLSKAHSDQSLVSGDVQSRIAVYDEKIKTAKENIEADRKQLKQMDEAVDQTMARSSDEKGADKASNLRKSQQRDRSALAKDIEANQKSIAQLNDEAAPIRAEVRKVEAEVGPIKYIAAFIYGDNPDANVLEKAVTWVIIIIVSVFDPLAVILLLASQYSFQWFRKAEEEDTEEDVEEWFAQGRERARQLDQETKLTEGDSPAGPTGDVVISDTTVTAQEVASVIPEAVVTQEELDALFAEPVEEVVVEDDHADFDINDSEELKAAKAQWKSEHPDDSLKNQRRLYEIGAIPQLPWEAYLTVETPEAVAENDAAAEALKWAQEQMDRPGDYLPETDQKKR